MISRFLRVVYGHGNATNVMADSIGLGTRRNPTAWDAAIVDYLYWTSKRER